MTAPCPKCGEDMTQDGVWPVGDGDGCLMCWEAECGDLWWEMVHSLPAEETT